MAKRVICVTADKGGTGKSTCSRGFADIYLRRDLKVLLYDCDKRNSQLFRHYNNAHPVNRLDIFSRGGADSLLDDLESEKPEIVLVDLPAQAGEAFERQEKELRLFDDAKELGYSSTVVSVLSRVKDCVNSLRLLIEHCDDRCDYVVVKNLFYGEEHKFARYNGSNTRQEVLKRGGIEIVMPDLFDTAYDFVDENSLTFRDALQSSTASRANRSRVHSWLTQVEAEMQRAGEYLGLGETR